MPCGLPLFLWYHKKDQKDQIYEDQKANDKNAQNWRVVQNFQPLNAQVVTEENALPLVENMIAIAEGKKSSP